MDASLVLLLNSPQRIVGSKQVLRGLKNGTVAQVWIAVDADTFLYQQIARAAEAAHVPLNRIGSMRELGDACGVQVKTAAAAVPKA